MTKRSIKIYTLLFVCLCVIPFSTYAVKPIPPTSGQSIELNEKTILQELEKAKGGRLNIFEKLIARSAIKKARKKTIKRKYKNGERKKDMAIAALILGIASFLVFSPVLLLIAIPAAITAIVFGSIAWKRAREDPENYGGKGMALAGMILGIVFLVSLILFALLIFLIFATLL